MICKSVPVIRVASNLRPAARALIVPMVSSTVFCILIGARGVPALRQDWTWPHSAAQVQTFLVTSWGGWNPAGLGSPEAYASSYIIAVPLWALMVVIGSTPAFFVVLMVLGLSLAFGARALVKGAPGLADLAVPIAMFNPWVYAKMVAGHILMVFAYAGTMILFGAIFAARRPARFRATAMALTLILAQVQFFLISLFLLVLRCRDRYARRSVFFGLVLFLPIAIGVLCNLGPLSAIPFTVEWQQSQSVRPGDAAFLLGYFAGYTSSVDILFRVAMAPIILLAIFGGIAMLRSRGDRPRALLFITMGGICTMLSLGFHGPLAAPYEYAVRSFPVTAVFRELYDILAYLAIAYVSLAVFAAQHSKVAARVLGTAGIALVAVWCIRPPSTFFASYSSVPQLAVTAPPNSRFALLPALQPMSYDGQGSGVDPDAYSLPRNVQPLNTYGIDYVSTAALQEYAQDGSTSELAALGVSEVIARPWLHSDAKSLLTQIGRLQLPLEPRLAGTRRISSVPQLGLSPVPHEVSIGSRVGANGVFFGDVPRNEAGVRAFGDQPHFSSAHPDNLYANADKGWVDARFVFLSFPRLAQGLGGAATFSNRAVLQLPAGSAVLAYANGTLRTEGGTVLVSHTRGYVWSSLPMPTPMRVRCDGFCIVVGTADRLPPPSAPQHYAAVKPVEFSSQLPAFVTASVPAHGDSLLRFGVAYDWAWVALAGGQVLPHLRIDEVINGWILSASTRRERVLLFNAVSITQTFFEAAGFALVVWLFAHCAYARKGQREEH